jgi:hypothetical protein
MAIIVYLSFSLMAIMLSSTTPIGTQIRLMLAEVIIMLFSIQTYLLFKVNPPACKVMLTILGGVFLFNVFYCVFFEIILRVNPAGLPLYILLDVDDNDFLMDMIDTERGTMDFRLQSVYGHPNSLGQYLVVLFPLLFMKTKINYRWLLIIIVCTLIFFTGSRSAIVPMVLVLILNLRYDVSSLVRKTFLLLVIGVFSIALLPDRQWKNINDMVGPFVTILQFWDDEKQANSDIEGSTMEMRFNQFDAANKEIENNPFFGQGLGYREYWQAKHNSLHPDLLGYESILIYYLVERGWLGLFFFFLLLYYIYRNIFIKSTYERKTILIIFSSYLLSLVMIGVRPLSFLFVCLASSMVCGLFPLRTRP